MPQTQPFYNQKKRPRRLRQNESIRSLVEETHLKASDFILPLFIKEGEESSEIKSMKGCYRYSLKEAIEQVKKAHKKGIKGIALFPVVDESLKDSKATEATNPYNLACRSLRAIKEACPEMLLIADVALDPYSSDGHDGLVENGKVCNDETVNILCKMALIQARAGADIIAPSDMMDGRIAAIRNTLEEEGFKDTLILSYSAKYCSTLYAPFREALDSAPKAGNKKTYQMNPANRLEAQKEAKLDEKEGADLLMVKPALFYLDIIRELKNNTTLPIVAYQVSGEYALIMNSTLTETQKIDLMKEALLSIKRAGADIIISYMALEILEYL